MDVDDVAIVLMTLGGVVLLVCWIAGMVLAWKEVSPLLSGVMLGFGLVIIGRVIMR